MYSLTLTLHLHGDGSVVDLSQTWMLRLLDSPKYLNLTNLPHLLCEDCCVTDERLCTSQDRFIGVSDPPGYIAGVHWLIKRDSLIKKIPL